MNERSEQLTELVRRLEGFTPLDEVGRALQPLVRRITKRDDVKRMLSGATLGHRLHPLLTDIPIGCWTAASLTDVFAWRSGRSAARRLVAVGVVASVPTAIAGLSDWDDTHGGSRRVGVVHASANSIALLLQVQSWRARRRGRHVRGALYGLAGLGAVTVGGYLGGHLVYAQRVGVDHEVPMLDDHDWHEACHVDYLVEGNPFGVSIGDTRIALVRRGTEIFAMAAVCTHAGGPLDRGEVRGDTLICPWHGSAFCLADGTVERGPATTSEPVYETRRRGDVIDVRTRSTVLPLAPAAV
jgi:nitrite reductase/ring-hydroxylating ferredoxin subunit/uncharacterized membrane protein